MRRVIASMSFLFCLSCTAHAAPNGSRRGPDAVDTASTAKIREYTTEPAFLTPWVDYLPASRTVPSPTQFLGYVVGTPATLTQPDKINDYFRALAKASRRVQVFSMGKTHGGREMIVAAIADAALLRRLDAIKRANKELADPRVTDIERARQLAATTPPMYYMTAGLHSPETGPPEMVMELGYRLAVSEQEHIKTIRKNVITLITPVLEMDGRARMVDWYYRHLTKVTELEDSPPRMAPYWGDYTAHDNNRDGLQLSQPLTRNYTDTFHEFLPVVSLDLHESVPLLYVSLGTGPYNETIDPITVTEWQWLSSYEVAEATKLGLRGVWTWGFYTGWYPGYLLWVTNNHNAVGRFYETFGNGNPGTFERDLTRHQYAKRRINAREWYRPWPPEKRLRWSLRNNTNYMQTAVLASLQMVAQNRDKLMFNFWQKSKNSLDKGTSEPPYAFHIPAEQRDRRNLHHLLWLLSGHRIEVHRVTEAKKLGKSEIAVGDYLVRMDQPYRNFARTLLMKQMFPKTAEHTPYDDVAWSLDYMLGVKIHPLKSKDALTIKGEKLADVPELPGQVDSGSAGFIVSHAAQTALASLRWALPKSAKVSALTAKWQDFGPGSLIVKDVDRDELEQIARRLHIDVKALSGTPDVPTVPVDLPRIALFHTWTYTQDSGWARYSLEQLGIDFTIINKDQLRAGNLRDSFDVIIVPSQSRLSLKVMIHGIESKWGPLPYTRTEKYPSHGVIDSSPDITGGMGFVGLANLEQFVRSGGVLVGLGSGGKLGSDTGMVRRVGSTQTAGTPGSHVATRILRKDHPLTWGYPERTYVFRGNLPVYNVRDYDRGLAVMQFGDKTWVEAEREADIKAGVRVDRPDPEADKGASTSGDPGGDKDGKVAGESAPNDAGGKSGKAGKAGKKRPLALSGLVKKPAELDRRPALLDVPVGQGRAILFSWNPLHRYQNHRDIPFLTNALLFFNDLPDKVPTRDEMRRLDTGDAGDTGEKDRGKAPAATGRQ